MKGKRIEGLRAMREEREIRELEEELDRLTGFVGEYGPEGILQDKDFVFLCTVVDIFGWVLGEVTTEHFRSDAYLNMDKAKGMVKEIEKRTARRLEDYE